MFSVIKNYIRYNGGLHQALVKLAHSMSTLLRDEGLHGLQRQWRETALRMRLRERETRRKQALSVFQTRRALRILATKHTAYVASMLQVQFARFEIAADIVIDLQHRPDPELLYVVICPQMFAHVPRHMIAFQMEQSTSSRWFDARYLDRLHQAYAVLDYSTINIAYLQSRGLPTSLLYYYPIHPIAGYPTRTMQPACHDAPGGAPEYDAVFYGDVRCPRRRRALDELSRRFRILILSEVFGDELYSALRRARVVLNIHYYEPSLLETTRLSECVSLGLPVISESGLQGTPHENWNGWVRFVPPGDIEAMATEIESVRHHFAHTAPPYQPSAIDVQAWDFHTGRLLLGCGLISHQEVARRVPLVTLERDAPVCLSMPETPRRRTYAIQNSPHPPHFFDGLRHIQAWKGCALSYWYLAHLALRAQHDWLEVYEDDCEFLPQSARALETARAYLRERAGGWDVFCALITTLPPDTSITKVETYQDQTFVHLDRTMGMVYSIFNASACAHLASWDPSNDDAQTNTIDRYLASRDGLRVITCLPYLVGHQEDMDSTLWTFGNQAYSPLIEASHRQLTRMVQDFYAAARTH